jgi:hypothetical protein
MIPVSVLVRDSFLREPTVSEANCKKELCTSTVVTVRALWLLEQSL